MRSLRDRLTYANVMATIAVFLALGGASWAAVKLPRNSVGSAQLKRGAVTGAKVRNGSLSLSDLRKGSLRAGLRGETGATGPAGHDGARGQQGPVGPAGPVDAYTGSSPGTPLTTLTSSVTSVVTTPTLPAGAYTIAARANVIAAAAGTSVLCSVASDAAQNVTVPATGALALSMAATARLGGPGTVSLDCRNASGAAQVAQAQVIATRVTTLTGG